MLLISAACVVCSSATAQAVPVAIHTTLRGPGTIVDQFNGNATVCSAPAGTLATQITVCDSSAEALFISPNNYQVFIFAHGPRVNGSFDDAGWAPSAWSGACQGGTGPCAAYTPCIGAGATPACVTMLPAPIPIRIEPVMSDLRAPTTTIASGPAAADVGGSGSPTLTPDGRAHFTFTTNENQEAPTYQCSVDGAPSTPCSSSLTTGVLSSNFHTLDVKATDNSGLAGSILERKWDNELDPKVIFSSAPGAFLRATSFAFAWHDVRADVDSTSYFCRFDSTGAADFNPCGTAIAKAGLAQGAHHLDVEARIHAINGDDVFGSITSSRFTVDTIPPDTHIVFGPDDGLITNQNDQTIVFTGTGGASGFQCSLDKSAFAACASPDKLADLKVGAHTFTVRAIDAAGNVDPTPETRSFRVISHFPSLGSDSSMSVRFFRKYTQVTHLYVTKLPKGAAIKVSCKGKGCKKKSATQKVKKKTKKLDVVKLLKHAHLGKKALVTVQVTQPGFNGVVVRFLMKIAASPSKTTLCLPAGETKPKSSC